jgi:N-acetylglucosaminyl-diphospho-decaprenol L-rhamnosyltransferase
MLVDKLLSTLNNSNISNLQIIITFNIPENIDFINKYDYLTISIIENKTALGYGENHNNAFKISTGSYFVVCNPDIEFFMPALDMLASKFETTVGIVAPGIVGKDNIIQDSVRKFPTILGLLLRRLKIRDNSLYSPVSRDFAVDWAAGMFLMFTRHSFRLVGGFDESYYLYFEDIDICKRMNNLGFKILYVPNIKIIHNARHSSRKSFQYFIWHLHSAFKYFKKWR